MLAPETNKTFLSGGCQEEGSDMVSVMGRVGRYVYISMKA